MPKESKAERDWSRSTDQFEQCLQIISEAFNVLTGGPGRVQTGGPGRVQTPKQAKDNPEWTQGVAVAPRKAMIQSSLKWYND